MISILDLSNQQILFLIIAFVVGFIIGGVIFSRVIFKTHKVGTLVIDDTDESVTRCSIQLEDVSFSELPEDAYVSLRVKRKHK